MLKILVVEDDTNTRKLMCAVLNQNGYSAVPAVDGIDALEIMDKHHVDLAIIDVMMPRMDGYELTRQLRQSWDQLPILMVTAKQTAQDKKQGFIVGTDDYMTKPVDEEEMLLRIKALLRRAQIVQEQKLVIGDVTLEYNALTVSRGKDVYTLPQKIGRASCRVRL